MKQAQSKMDYIYALIEECVESITQDTHAIIEHQYKTDEQLKTRVSVEKTIGASCFAKDVDAVELITDCIYDSIEILQWMKNNKVTEDLIIHLEQDGCGKKFIKNRTHNWEDGAIVCNVVTVILGKKMDKAGCLTGIFLKTAYPE